ncbi:hypothetical protein KIN20_036562 [Parelaphostrongylus tenuis]|uniref:Uncharacterized protein n=1 Tax=Parelaphostrongylus tenuis TaxID=148309 RepID=A0AAD5WKI7_PARTN|nr:hypothetical protein KIN20_036562 [Parelaphostrongylus tenuis]
MEPLKRLLAFTYQIWLTISLLLVRKLDILTVNVVSEAQVLCEKDELLFGTDFLR